MELLSITPPVDREESAVTNHHDYKDQNEELLSSKQQHQEATEKELSTAEWDKIVEEFASQVFDSSYVPHPIRSTTINAAKEYNVSGITPPDSKGLMPGTHKHLGGAYDPSDGCIYGVPAHSRSVLCLYPVTKENDDGSQVVESYKIKTIPLPESIQKGRFKWLRGIFAHGYLWAIPAWADSVLCVDVDAFWGRREPQGDIVNLLPLPEDHVKGLRWQWHGAGINHEKTAIFCIPSNAKSVLKVDIIQKTTSLIPIDADMNKYPNFSIDQTNKWYGGIVGKDNAVYGIPYRGCAVLRIDSKTETATLIGPDYGIAKYNWHGGIQVNGKIYAHPSHAETVLVIDTNENINGETVFELPIHRASYDQDPKNTYKWLGGATGADGNIYCPACDTSAVLKIDTKTDYCTTFGFAGKEKNKWQGGILGRDGCIYCIPASGRHILRIATAALSEDEEQNKKLVQLVGNLPATKDKWQGGFNGLDGALYFIPENGYRVLKVTPPLHPPELNEDGSLPSDEVRIEML